MRDIRPGALLLISVLYMQNKSNPVEPNFDWNDPEKEELFKYVALRCLQKKPEMRFQRCQERPAQEELKFLLGRMLFAFIRSPTLLAFEVFIKHYLVGSQNFAHFKGHLAIVERYVAIKSAQMGLFIHDCFWVLTPG